MVDARSAGEPGGRQPGQEAVGDDCGAVARVRSGVRQLMVWRGSTVDGEAISGSLVAATFPEVAREAERLGADMRRLLHVRPASSSERLAIVGAIQDQVMAGRADERCGALWHVSGDRWGSVRSRQRRAA